MDIHLIVYSSNISTQNRLQKDEMDRTHEQRISAPQERPLRSSGQRQPVTANTCITIQRFSASQGPSAPGCSMFSSDFSSYDCTLERASLYNQTDNGSNWRRLACCTPDRKTSTTKVAGLKTNRKRTTSLGNPSKP